MLKAFAKTTLNLSRKFPTLLLYLSKLKLILKRMTLTALNPVEALNFFRFLYSNCVNWKFTEKIISHFKNDIAIVTGKKVCYKYTVSFSNVPSARRAKRNEIYCKGIVAHTRFR